MAAAEYLRGYISKGSTVLHLKYSMPKIALNVFWALFPQSEPALYRVDIFSTLMYMKAFREIMLLLSVSS